MTSAKAIELAIGSTPPDPFHPATRQEVLRDPAYRFHPQFTWTGEPMRLALPFSRRRGASLVSSSTDPVPVAILRRTDDPVARGPGCE